MAIALDILLLMGLFYGHNKVHNGSSMGLFWTHYSETGAFLGYQIHVHGPTRQPIKNANGKLAMVESG